MATKRTKKPLKKSPTIKTKLQEAREKIARKGGPGNKGSWSFIKPRHTIDVLTTRIRPKITIELSLAEQEEDAKRARKFHRLSIKAKGLTIFARSPESDYKDHYEATIQIVGGTGWKVGLVAYMPLQLPPAHTRPRLFLNYFTKAFKRPFLSLTKHNVQINPKNYERQVTVSPKYKSNQEDQ